MKKVISILLLVAFALSLTACGGGGNKIGRASCRERVYYVV